MPSTILTTLLFILATLTLSSTTFAFPLFRRDIQWSFNLFPTDACDGPSELHIGTGSTGCRADLGSVASAYTVNVIPEGCRIEFYDNTMCDRNELSDLAGPMTRTQVCRVPNLHRRYASYRVTCGHVDV
ncbi:hypothetical protein N7539_008950 [Penicillium diatomitis]|uniref:Uncharacterized protein n=1 Tax=Penicillium diatomitis TaxID=2819901 RepID=A0A9W9WL06_9EURO|nr:uncharacterized protein N7539_008950 [Penicillium diatomitis]KAJ5469332.1 hypothetical protein N7539_008950 [Penicillium diatomitis]